MGQIAAALGAPVEFTYDGRTYKLSPLSYDIQGAFERHLEAAAVEACRRMRPHLSDDEYREQLAETRRDIGAGAYTFGSDLVSKAWLAKPHFKHLVYLCLKPNHSDITPDLVSKMVDADLAEIFAKVGEANTDPTKPTTPSVSSGPDAASPSATSAPS